MKSHPQFALALGLAAALTGFLRAGSTPAPNSAWEPAESWDLAVQVYPRPHPSDLGVRNSPSRPEAFVLRVLVTGQDQVGTADCWRLAFLPDPKAPLPLPHSYYVSVDKEEGWPHRLLCVCNLRPVPPAVLGTSAVGVAGTALGPASLLQAAPRHASYSWPADLSSWLQPCGDGVFLDSAPEGFPIETFPCSAATFSSAAAGYAWVLQRQVEGENCTVEAILKVGEEEPLRIRQKWVKGEPWWREYERFVQGGKDLEARRLGGSLGKQAQAAAHQERNPGQPPADAYPLRRDWRLQARVSVTGMNPDVSDLLTQLQSATGLSLTLADNLARHRPALGYAHLPNVPAWVVMEWLAESQLQQGHWEPTEGGYQLTGTSTTSPAPLPPGNSILPYVALAIGAGLVLLGGLILFRLPRASGKEPQGPS